MPRERIEKSGVIKISRGAPEREEYCMKPRHTTAPAPGMVAPQVSPIVRISVILADHVRMSNMPSSPTGTQRTGLRNSCLAHCAKHILSCLMGVPYEWRFCHRIHEGCSPGRTDNTV